MLLIFPPVAKACEPPAGLARLSGMLSFYDIQHDILDANIEGLLYILEQKIPQEKLTDVWSKSAFQNIKKNMDSLKSTFAYENKDRYIKTIRDITHILGILSPKGCKIGLADYSQENLSPTKTTDLNLVAREPEKNPFYPYFSDRVREYIARKSIHLVGISLNYLSQALCAFSMAGFIRKEFPHLKIIMGGGLITSWIKKLKASDCFSWVVDSFIDGPGERALQELAGVPKNKRMFFLPDYSRLPLNSYLSPGLILPYSTSSGCYWRNCDFCPEKAQKTVYHPVPISQTLKEIQHLNEKFQPVLIHFLDNAISPALLKSFSAQTPRRPWYGFTRIIKELANLDFCKHLRNTGCIMLKLGIESGDQEVLDRLHKGIDLKIVSLALQNLRKAGIATYVYLLFGTPVETKKSAYKTWEFTARHSDCIQFLNLAIFNMPVDGEEFLSLEKKPFSLDDLSLYTDFVHPDGWDRKNIRLFLDREFKRDAEIARILQNDPPVFTSNHAAFMIKNSLA